ncbi:S-layer homology domain-containing protein [Cohnella boryungensis]|uniref:S-layer homology domain-containing protein n=1 Tax=Cohnella boryungensis TaxID=768479 RepID=UPI00367002BE
MPGPIAGDTRYTPIKWEVLETGEVEYALHFAIPSVGTANYYPTAPGRYTIEVTFKKEQYDGNGYWTDMNANDTKTSTTVIVSGPPTLADVNNNTAELSASIIKEGSSVTVTAEGDRQSATGVSHQDERYFPNKWVLLTTDGSEEALGNIDYDDVQDSYSSVITPLTEGEYELKVSFQKQVYDLKGELWLTVFGESSKSFSLTVMPVAKPEKNTLSATPSSKEVTLGDSFTLTAVGDRQSETGSFDGNERFIPVSWALSDGTSGLFSLNGGSYTSQYTPLSAGTRTVTATYKKQVWNSTDNQWEDTGVTDTKTIDLTAMAATGPTQPTEADAGNNSVSANPSSVTTGTAATLTATGDRQSADGAFVGDERYVPVSWSSAEIGKAGTFTKGSNGIYTSDYTPSITGSHTVTATFQMQTWNGTTWVAVTGANDTKTTTVTATAATGPTQPTEADAGNNSVSANPSSVTTGGTATLTATGDRQSADGAFVGDERYVPVSWSSAEIGKTGTFTKGSNGIYTSDYTPSITGSHTVTATFQMQTWNGTAWVTVAGANDTKTTTVTVTAATGPTEADAANNSVSANPSSATTGTAATLTATGDRQSADGAFVGDERYVPVSWSSAEIGKTGTFTKGSNGSYTSAYTPSITGSHTVTATFQMQTWNGTTWVAVTGANDTKTTTVTATAVTGPTQPTEADAGNNSVSANPSSVTTGTAATLTATGDRQSADGAFVGDERYVPVSWSSAEIGKTGTFTKGSNGIYTSDYTPSVAGSHTVTATFQMQSWNGTAWVVVAGANDTKTTTVTVTAATGPTEADAANNSVTANPSSVTTGTAATLTATGDRQSADGAFVGDERYVPVSWSSAEIGKTGTFTKGSNGIYTSDYTPSITGSHTVTATFQMQTWNGMAWVVVTGANDTKTTTVTVTAATGPTEADAANNSVSANPSSVTTGTAATLTATGDRQSADGAFVGDERYVPVSWSSAEIGKTGTFTKGSNGSYTSSYTPSITGSHTVTATFQMQTWNGTAWVAVAGANDTKTTTVTVTAATGPTEAKTDNNSVSASPSSVTTGTAVTLTADGDRQSADGAFVGDERYVPVSWSSTESGKTGTFTKGSNGSYASAYTPSVAGSHTVTATFQKQRWNGTTWVVVAGATDTKTIVVTVSNGSSGSTPLPSTSTSEGETETSVIVLVNGKAENAGTAKSTTINGQSVMTILVDQKKIEEKLAIEGFGAVVTVPVKTNSDVVVAQLNGQLIREMEDLHATLVVKTDRAIYTVPSLQINMNEVSSHIGTTVPLQDIKVELQFGTTPTDMAKIVAQAATNGSFTPVMPAMDFIVKYTYGDKTVEISTFSIYVERAIAIPEGIDPNRITTGVVVDPDGTSRHVPTKITIIDGRYYAVINSLTNSTYSVVWHPLEFSDVAKHWSKDAANDMGSRMVIEGTGNDQFSPNRDITRAEFVAIMVRGLGLKPSKEAAPFLDVKEKDWYNTAISTAFAYGLIDGIGDGTFRPNDKITREQAMVIIVKAMKITGLKAKLSAKSIESLLRPFADAAASSEWAKSGIADSIQAGIIIGKSDTQLAPKAYITRAEAAAVIQRLLRKSDLI